MKQTLRERLEAEAKRQGFTDVELQEFAFESVKGGPTEIVDVYVTKGDVDGLIYVAEWESGKQDCRLQFTGDYEVNDVTFLQALQIIAAANSGNVRWVPGQNQAMFPTTDYYGVAQKYGWKSSPWEDRAGIPK